MNIVVIQAQHYRDGQRLIQYQVLYQSLRWVVSIDVIWQIGSKQMTTENLREQNNKQSRKHPQSKPWRHFNDMTLHSLPNPFLLNEYVKWICNKVDCLTWQVHQTSRDQGRLEGLSRLPWRDHLTFLTDNNSTPLNNPPTTYLQYNTLPPTQ